MNNQLSFFRDNLSQPGVTKPIFISAYRKCQLIIEDKTYYEFIEEVANGGFFFDQSLQFMVFTKRIRMTMYGLYIIILVTYMVICIKIFSHFRKISSVINFRSIQLTDR
jgi:hypothetical protein